MLPGLSISVLAAGAVVALEESAGRQSFSFPAGFTREVGVGDGTLEIFLGKRGDKGTDSLVFCRAHSLWKLQKLAAAGAGAGAGAAAVQHRLFLYAARLRNSALALMHESERVLRFPCERKRESPMHGPPRARLATRTSNLPSERGHGGRAVAGGE